MEKLNSIIEDYINYLARHNPMFLDNAIFFSALYCDDERFKLSYVECENIKMNAVDSFKIAKEFYEIYYNEDIQTIENMFSSGIFDIYYLDELEEEKIYVEGKEKRFTQQTKDGHYNIRLPLRGNINDTRSIIHEIRHQLNQPKNGRNSSNDTLTEALSMFDELLMFDFLENKITKETNDKIKNNYFYQIIKNFSYVNFVCNLVSIKDKLGYISEENYEMLFGISGKKEFISDCIEFEKQINTYKDITADFINWYTFATFLIFTMYSEYKSNPSYLDKVKQLNECLKNNVYITEALNVVNIDLAADDIIDKLRNNLMETVKEFNQKVRNNML